MRRDDDDPFDEFFREIERMMDEMMGAEGDVHIDRDGAGGGSDLHIDVHETDDEIRVVADIPGIEKEAIDLKCDGNVLTIDADSHQREYHERLTLPSAVDEHSASATYNNGILEVTFDREEDSADIEL
ncbi:Hsp20/alpha crystallin family protein [Haloarcula nitratireducens]|uniref:Hsp20/alpha crystallin family protein n=1 Tax=Haloarcula nitratireducens TaxID=2487749 RepID=A0AAW4PC11_9EURY|nr:Hsp20/alpha crystallin family protein [Halomicroarcula nitratireducens]MBX0295358.1 Hsp20/alpha crystallin family protein [Halomicroarcula nitratireducens]